MASRAPWARAELYRWASGQKGGGPRARAEPCRHGYWLPCTYAWSPWGAPTGRWKAGGATTPAPRPRGALSLGDSLGMGPRYRRRMGNPLGRNCSRDTARGEALERRPPRRPPGRGVRRPRGRSRPVPPPPRLRLRLRLRRDRARGAEDRPHPSQDRRGSRRERGASLRASLPAPRRRARRLGRSAARARPRPGSPEAPMRAPGPAPAGREPRGSLEPGGLLRARRRRGAGWVPAGYLPGLRG